MLISKNWLEQFVDLSDISAETLAESLTIHAVEVEGVTRLDDMLQHIVVGKITSVEKHPDANALQLCQVSVGKKSLQVVCGGSNVADGMKVAMGMIGAKVRWHGEGDLVELAQIKIRGQESFGMICAADEIGLGDLFRKKNEKEILDLSYLDADVGTPLAQALSMSDTIIELDNKSMTHRPDLWGHYGVARELSAIYSRELREYLTEDIAEDDVVKLRINVKDTDLCSRYMGVVMDGISVGSSPDWMQQRLAAVGINPINNIVDITNFVMAELGQPMHAFDAEKLESNDIIVRRAKKGERIVTLGGDEHVLSGDMLVIADKKCAIAIAGVKGGDDSGVNLDTTSIVFEAANFDAISVRKTSAAIGLRTDASSRFEKSLDPTMVEVAMRRAVALVLDIIPSASVVSNITDAGEWQKNQEPIVMRMSYVRERIGVDIPKTQVEEILRRLGFVTEEQGDALAVTVPSWRATKDVSAEEDLIEEIARIYGYNNIPVTLPKAIIEPAPTDPLKKMTRIITKRLAYEGGYSEVYNYSFVSPEWLKKMNVEADTLLELDNPIAKDRPYLRRNLFPNMLKNVEQNLHRYDRVKLFEIGKTFVKEEFGESCGKGKERLPKQDTYVGIVYAAKEVDIPFFAIADTVRMILDTCGVQYEFETAETDEDFIHPGRCARIMVDGVEIGLVAELHPLTQNALGIPHRTGIAQINMNDLLHFSGAASTYVPLPEYPSMERDVAFIVDANIHHKDILAAMKEMDSLIGNVTLFDVYQGRHVPEGKKSMAYHIEYLSREKTLMAEEVDAVHTRVVEMLKKEFYAEVRT